MITDKFFIQQIIFVERIGDVKWFHCSDLNQAAD